MTTQNMPLPPGAFLDLTPDKVDPWLKWDKRFLKLAAEIAKWSKDPSTKCGAVIVRPDKTIASVGYNGFPRGMDDDPSIYADREQKYKRVIHAEMNAILNAKEPLDGFRLYVTPFLTCDRCAAHVIQSGIKHVITYKSGTDDGRWDDAWDSAKAMYAEARVKYLELDY